MEPSSDTSHPRAGDPSPSRRVGRKRPTLARVAGYSAVAVGLAVGAGAVAGAATTGSAPAATAPASPAGSPRDGGPLGGTRPAAMGTVKSVGNGSFTLTEHDGTVVTVDVGSTTTYLDPGVTSPTIANVTVGEHVAVVGTDTSNTVTATKVLIGGPGGPGRGGPRGPLGGTRPAAMGTVKSVGNGSFALTEHDGTVVTVNVGSTTTYLDPGVTSPTTANVTVGEHVAVVGTDTSNTVTATKVLIGGPGGPGGHGRPGGPGPSGTANSGTSSAGAANTAA